MAHNIVNGFCESGCKVPVAPLNHASPDAKYGAGSDTQYGHVKLMPLLFENVEDSGGFKTPDGEIISYDDLKGYAASAWALCVFNEVLNIEIADIENQLEILDKAFLAVRKKVITLEESMAALTDAEGVEF